MRERPANAAYRTIEEIARIELDAGLVGMYLEITAGIRVFGSGGYRRKIAGMVQHKIMVVASAELKLLVILIDAGAYFRRLPEIERRFCHWLNFSRRNQSAVHRSEAVCVEHEFFVQDGAAARAAQIEVRMVGQVHDCVFVRRGAVVDVQRVFIVQRIANRNLELARIALFAVLTRVAKLQARTLVARDFLSAPHAPVETPYPAVQAVGAVVYRHMIGMPI